MSRRLNLILNIVIVAVILLVGAGSAYGVTTVLGIINQPNQDFRPATYTVYVAGKDDMATGSCQYTGTPNQYTASQLVVLDNYVSTLVNGDECVVIFGKEDDAGLATHKGYYAVNHQVITMNNHYDVLWSDAHEVPQPTGTPGNGQVALSWSPATDDGSGNILGYDLYRSTDPTMAGAIKVNSSVIAGTNYTDTTVTNETTYYYSIVIVFRGTASYPQLQSYGSANSNACRPSASPDTTPPVVDDTTYPVTDGPTPTVDIDEQASTTSISANWVGTFSDPESGIWYYEYCVGTTSGNNDVVDWTNVGGATGMTNNSVTLINGQTYYVTVRATNNFLLTSTPSTSDGVTVNISGDTTPPVGGWVNDSLGADIDFQSSTDTLSANWGGFSDPDSGVTGYQYAIGTTSGGTDIVDWTGIDGATDVTVSSLTLDYDQIYYVTVRAYNGAGLYTELSSDGVNVVDIGSTVPNYPNPFNPPTESTRIVVDVPGPMDIGAYIYDITARLIYKDVILGANGLTEIIWNGTTYYGHVADNGVYLVRIIDEGSKQLIGKGKILVIKK